VDEDAPVRVVVLGFGSQSFMQDLLFELDQVGTVVALLVLVDLSSCLTCIDLLFELDQAGARPP
jgi:hypothetical protein